MPGRLYKRGETWWGRVRIAGREHSRSLRTRSRAEAQRRLDRWAKDLGEAQFFGEERRTWEAAALRYVREVLPQAVKPATAKRYIVSLKQVDAILSPLYLDQVDKKAIARVAARPGVTNATKRRDLTAVSRVLAACVQWGWRDDNPAKDWDRSLIRERRDPIVLPTDEEIEAVLELAPGNLARLFGCLRWTGMRMEEAGGLLWSQVDMNAGQITLHRTKTDRPRVIQMDTPVGSVRGTIGGTARHLHSPFVFHHDGARYHNISSRFAELRNRANTRIRLHDLRHRFAVDWLRNGGDIYRLQQHLGHSSIKTTEIYLDYTGGQTGVQQRRFSAKSEVG